MSNELPLPKTIDWLMAHLMPKKPKEETVSNDERPRTISETTRQWLMEQRQPSATVTLVLNTEDADPHWSIIPPPETGWYRYRSRNDYPGRQWVVAHWSATRMEWHFAGREAPVPIDRAAGEWWSEPIQEPPR